MNIKGESVIQEISPSDTASLNELFAKEVEKRIPRERQF